MVSGEGYDERAAADCVECRTRGGPSKSVEQRFRLRIVHEVNMQRRERQRHEIYRRWKGLGDRLG